MSCPVGTDATWNPNVLFRKGLSHTAVCCLVQKHVEMQHHSLPLPLDGLSDNLLKNLFSVPPNRRLLFLKQSAINEMVNYETQVLPFHFHSHGNFL